MAERPVLPDPAEQATLRALDRLGVPYELLPCDPAFADTAAFCARYGHSPAQAANTIVVASKKEPRQFAACVVTATTRLDVNRAVRDLLDVSKVSFASAEDMRRLTGMAVGGVTAFGLPEGVPLFVDARVMACETVILGTGGRNGKIRIAPAVFQRIPGARVVPGLAIEAPGA
jgi:prolyl-tRNA editing enzyme YbaK/EbsC (Cys-tRNA(Pro) deacylase)